MSGIHEDLDPGKARYRCADEYTGPVSYCDWCPVVLHISDPNEVFAVTDRTGKLCTVLCEKCAEECIAICIDEDGDTAAADDIREQLESHRLREFYYRDLRIDQ